MEKIKALIDLAFETGKWAGQVELEEHYDREQYSAVMPEVFSSKKTNLPADLASPDRTVRVNLRSQAWRDGVRKTCAEKITKIKNMIEQPKRKPLADGTLELTENELKELSEIMKVKVKSVTVPNKVNMCVNNNSVIMSYKAIAYILDKFELEK